MANDIINNFTAGELSPKLYGRTDLAKYFNGCRELYNMTIWPHGGAFRMPGSQFVASAKYANKKTILVRFSFSTLQQYVIEVGDKYMRFYKDKGQILSETSPFGPYEIVTPYSEDELEELDFTGSADVLYICHPKYMPRKLTRTGHAAWSLSLLDPIHGPFNEDNKDDENNLTVSAYLGSTGLYGTTVTITSQKDLFTATLDEGRWIKIYYEDDGTEIGRGSVNPSAAGYIGGTYLVDGKFEVTYSFGDGNGNSVILRYSVDGGSTYKDYATFPDITEQTRVIFQGELRSEDYNNVVPRLRFYVTGDSHNFWWSIRKIRESRIGYVKITTVSNSKSVRGKVYRRTNNFDVPTTNWALGSWGDVPGYPHVATFFEQRLWFGATDTEPQTVWASKTGDYEDFEPGAEDDNAVSYTIASEEVNTIKWLKSKSGLIIGTVGAEWRLTSTQDAPVSPSNVSIRRETTYGSCNVRAEVAAGNVIYVQPDAKRVMQFAYNLQEDTYVGYDLTLMSEHITGPGLVALFLQKNPLPVIWGIRSDGLMAGMTYLPYHDVTGWHRHETKGLIKSGTSIEDQLWLLAKREIDGSIVQYIEYIEMWDETMENAIFMDCSACYDGDEKDITGATKADPVVITSVAHGLSNGDKVRISEVVGMTELNDRIFTVANKENDSFELFEVDGSEYGAYVSGGIAKKCASTVSGLGYLEGEEVNVLVDGSLHRNLTVESETISLDEGVYGAKIWVGIPQPNPVLETMPIDIESREGTLQGHMKRIIRAVIRLYKTLTFKMSGGNSSYETAYFRNADDTLSDPPVPFTGTKKILMPKGSDIDAYVRITQDTPLPLTVNAIIYEAEAGER
jgi:hypothetical protein